MLLLYRYLNRFILICDYFAFVTAICGPTERTEVLVCPIFLLFICNFELLFLFWAYCWRALFFIFLGFFTIFLLDKE
jgi:hypothetical protein